MACHKEINLQMPIPFLQCSLIKAVLLQNSKKYQENFLMTKQQKRKVYKKMN